MSAIPESEFNDAMNQHGVKVCSRAAASARSQETILGAGLGVSRGVLHELLARQGPQRRVRPDDGDLRERLKALAQERRRFGYRRLQVLLRREGQVVNKRRVQRIYREERLTVRRRGGVERAIGARTPIGTPLAPNQR